VTLEKQVMFFLKNMLLLKPAYNGTPLTLPPNLRAVPDFSFGIW
jgi:hypothetical protein